MTLAQTEILLILGGTIVLFVWGRWRHDMVAMASLLACVVLGLVERSAAFAGFGHPAVITVACVLVLSRALQVSGAIDGLTRVLLPTGGGPFVTIALLTALAAVLSAFMNNVGALALLMPVAIVAAGKLQLPPGRILMPLAFGSILGGMTTLIGTPPNLIVSGVREEAGRGSFGMFDFTPVGLAVAAAGVLFVALIGWRLVPARQRADAGSFATGAYLTEARIEPESPLAGKTLHEAGPTLAPVDAQVVGHIRRDVRLPPPTGETRLLVGDLLILEAEPEGLAGALQQLGLKLAEEVPVKASPQDTEATSKETSVATGKKGSAKLSAKDGDQEISLTEVVVRPGTDLVGRSATDIHLRQRFGINLLALSRQGKRSIRRLRSERFRAGDVLLLQGPPPAVMHFSNTLGCVPLAQRELRIPQKRQALMATAIMLTAIVGAAFGLMPAAITFAAGVLVVMATRILPTRNIYEAVDWPVVVLLGALIPVAGALSTTGMADLMARGLVESIAGGSAVLALVLILVVTMTLSDFMNNAATAAVMCPIAISTAHQLGVNPDCFLMAVAIGASCAFLTPIGHQNNTLILGPGGFRFGDYWRLGLPLEIVVVVVSIPALLYFWPL